MKKIFVILVVVLSVLSGCASNHQRRGMPQHGQPMAYPGQVVHQLGYIAGHSQPMPIYNAQPVYYGGQSTVVATQPCQPFNADTLMGWAQGAGGSANHARSAQVTNHNGQITCYSSEAASSSNTRQNAAPLPVR